MVQRSTLNSVTTVNFVLTKMEKNPELWLKKHANWNHKKTIAKATVFNVPNELLVSTRDFQGLNSSEFEKIESETVFKTPTLTTDRGLTCGACRLQFSNVSEQHTHFKSDFHRCNLQRSVKNQSVLTEGEYLSTNGKDSSSSSSKDDNLLLDSEDSSSDSEGGDSEDGQQQAEWDEEASVMTSGTMGENKYFSNEEGTIVKEYSKAYGPQFLFQRNASPWRFTISQGAFQVSSLFYEKNWHKCEENPWSALSDQLQRLKSNMLSCVFLLRSGRFAGAVIENGKILVHKVLRRYTVRAKAGGAQSSHDNSSGKARSAGAMLRRYGEQALREDIQQLMTLWSVHIQCCHMVYIAAPRTMRGIFFDPAKDFTPPLRRDDARVSYIPFMTDRPTLEEIQLAYTRCTSVVFMKSTSGSNDGGNVNVSDERSVSVAGDTAESELQDQWNLMKEEVQLESNERRAQKQRRKQARQQQQQLQQQKAQLVVTVEGHLVEEGFVGMGNRLVDCPPSSELIAAITEGNERVAVRLLRAFGKRFGGTGEEEIGEHPSDDEEVEEGEEQEELNEDDQVKLALALSESVMLSGDRTVTDTATAGGGVNELQWDLKAVVNQPDSLVDLSTPLHLASARSMHRLVSNLLRAGASPCSLDVRGRPAYFLCSDNKTREAFRRYRGRVGEERYDWAVSGVGPPLTEEAMRAAKEKEKEKKKKAQQRKKENKKADEAAAKEAKELLERQKLEAIEAEARKQREAGRCGHCQVSLHGIKSFDVFDRRCCSGKCVIALRRALAGEAAMKRMTGSGSTVGSSGAK